MKFAIEVLEQSGSWSELCRVNNNPAAIAEAAREVKVSVRHTRRWWRVPKYHDVRVRELAHAG